jgi:hypothetical protein
MKLSDYILQEYKIHPTWNQDLDISLETLFEWVTNHKDSYYPEGCVYGAASLIAEELYEEYSNTYKPRTVSDVL